MGRVRDPWDQTTYTMERSDFLDSWTGVSLDDQPEQLIVDVYQVEQTEHGVYCSMMVSGDGVPQCDLIIRFDPPSDLGIATVTGAQILLNVPSGPGLRTAVIDAARKAARARFPMFFDALDRGERDALKAPDRKA